MGFTIPRVDTILAPYARKSYDIYVKEYHSIINNPDISFCRIVEAEKYAKNKVRRDFEQGFQSWEMSFNSVGSSRGDYPFIAMSFGLEDDEFGIMAAESALRVRMGGQGKEGFKRPVLFPKLTFIYNDAIHGEGKEREWLFNLALQCSSKTMYPDFLATSGRGYIPSIYKQYGKVISLMGRHTAHVKPCESFSQRVYIYMC